MLVLQASGGKPFQVMFQFMSDNKFKLPDIFYFINVYAIVVLYRYGLAVLHLWLSLAPIIVIWSFILTQFKYGKLEKKINSEKCNLWKTAWNGFRSLTSFCLLDIALPVCVFVALYGKALFDLSDDGVQYSIAFSIILASRRFMLAIAKFPIVGGKVYMLTKV